MQYAAAGAGPDCGHQSAAAMTSVPRPPLLHSPSPPWPGAWDQTPSNTREKFRRQRTLQWSPHPGRVIWWSRAELIVSDSATSTPISTDLLRGNVEKRGSCEDDWCLSKIVILRQLSGLGDTTQSKCRFICTVIVSEGTLRGLIDIILHMFPRIYPNPQTHIHLIWLICYL